MIPIIVGLGVTLGILSIKSTVSAIIKYKTLTPIEIARLNNIALDFNTSTTIDKNLYKKFQQYPGGFMTKCTESEAFLILGIDNDEILKLDEKLLQRKYRRVIMLNHPDKGGSVYITMKINQAKEVLENSYLMKK